jgi:hypothetical protein
MHNWTLDEKTTGDTHSRELGLLPLARSSFSSGSSLFPVAVVLQK